MTWNPRKRNYLMQRPSSASPLLSHSEDRDLEYAVQRLIYVEESIKILMKEMKKYVDTVGNLDKADQRLTTNLSSSELAHMNDDFRKIVEDYHSVTSQMGKTVLETEQLYYRTFIEPLKKLRDEFALIATAINKREELVTTWRNSYNRVKKLQEKREKTASHVAKLEREKRIEEAAAKELKDVHAQLLVELPMFLDKRLEYIKPSVHALILTQLDYYGNMTKLFTHFTPEQHPNEPHWVDERYHLNISEQMKRLRSLTIVKDPYDQ